MTDCYKIRRKKMAEREGFEPPVPFGITGFQDQLHKPLGHPSVPDIFCIITVNNNFVNELEAGIKRKIHYVFSKYYNIKSAGFCQWLSLG